MTYHQKTDVLFYLFIPLFNTFGLLIRIFLKTYTKILLIPVGEAYNIMAASPAEGYDSFKKKKRSVLEMTL